MDNLRVARLLCMLIISLAGCGKKPPAESSPASASVTPVAEAGGAPAQSSPRAVQPVVIQATDANAALPELTQSLRKFALEQKRLPKTFSEIVSAGYVQNLPTPPPGKKFEVDSKGARVVLVNQ
jgi:predicted small lipoprotein YifL